MKQLLRFIAAALAMCFFAPFNVGHAQVRADSGSIAIGGPVTGSTVISASRKKRWTSLFVRANARWRS